MGYKVYSNTKDITLMDSKIKPQDSIYELWRECFGDSISYTDFYFQWKVKDNQIYTVFKEDKIAAMLHLNPYVLNVRGNKIRTNYIVGVATKEEDRRQGLMRLLLEKAMVQMNEEQIPFTYLMPAKVEIYLPFGFRNIYEQEAFKDQIMFTKDEISKNGIHAIMHETIDIRVLNQADSSLLEKLVAFTNDYLESVYDVFVIRDSYYYQRLMHEMRSSKGEVMLVLHNGVIIGYIAYMKDIDIQVAEAIYLPNKKEEFWYGVTDRLMEDLSHEQRLHKPPTIMARIINLEAFISGMTAKKDISFIIGIRDEMIKSNHGNFEINLSKKGGKCIPTEKSPEIICDISELTQIFFGQLKEDKLLEKIVGKKDVILEKLNHINYYNRVFINDVV
ncbi:MAG: enhanced intracellular survival protein Eis [Anaerocolumna sp.]